MFPCLVMGKQDNKDKPTLNERLSGAIVRPQITYKRCPRHPFVNAFPSFISSMAFTTRCLSWPMRLGSFYTYTLRNMSYHLQHSAPVRLAPGEANNKHDRHTGHTRNLSLQGPLLRPNHREMACAYQQNFIFYLHRLCALDCLNYERTWHSIQGICM